MILDQPNGLGKGFGRDDAAGAKGVQHQQVFVARNQIIGPDELG